MQKSPVERFMAIGEAGLSVGAAAIVRLGSCAAASATGVSVFLYPCAGLINYEAQNEIGGFAAQMGVATAVGLVVNEKIIRPWLVSANKRMHDAFPEFRPRG